MYTIVNLITVKATAIDAFIDHVRAHAAASNREPGCLRYDVLQDTGDPAVICLYEVFESEAAFHAHLEMPHYQRWMEVSRDWREPSGRQRWVMDHLHWHAS